MPLKKNLKPLSPDARGAISLWNPKRNMFKASWTVVRTHAMVPGGKKPKGIIAKSELQLTKNFMLHNWIYYPRPEHFRIFDSAANWVRPHGPAGDFPGAVGSIAIMEHNKRYQINSMQAHFIQGKPIELSRSIATKYGGWRKRLLGEVFKQALAQKYSVSLPTSRQLDFKAGNPVLEGLQVSERERIGLFVQTARETGFEVKPFGALLVADIKQ